jgi:hypothetical protein
LAGRRPCAIGGSDESKNGQRAAIMLMWNGQGG